jgi:hypothetical protein
MQTRIRATTGAERRAEARYDTGLHNAHIAMAEPPMTCQVTVLDVSRSGLRLRTDCYLEVHRMVTVRVGDVTVAGRVCRSARNQTGTFDSGVLISDLSLV